MISTWPMPSSCPSTTLIQYFELCHFYETICIRSCGEEAEEEEGEGGEEEGGASIHV
jgi:hypothetical protein